MRDSLNRLIATILSLLGVLFLTVGLALASSVGPTIAGTGADNSGAGTITWTNPGNITANDSSYATAALQSFSGVVSTHYLVASNFGFSVPAGATINGIQVDLNRDISVGGGSTYDFLVQLRNGSGTLVGSNKADTVTTWGSSFATISYGGASDVWSTSLTDTDINSSSFGVVLQAQVKTISSSTPQVNYIQITVTYTAAGGAAQQQTLTMMGCGS